MLRPCPACKRHVAVTEPTCVFCEAPLAAGSSHPIERVGRLSRAMIFAGAITAAPLACGSPQVHYQPITVATANSGEVKGQITDHDGKPAALLEVALYSEALRSMPGNSTGSMPFQTDANGAFDLKNIPVGTYWIGRAGLRSDNFEVRNGQAAILSLELDKPKSMPVHGAKPYGAPPARRRLV